MTSSSSEFSSQLGAETLELTWKGVRECGYAVLSDEMIKISAKFRARFLREYFNERVLRRYADDTPADRERARDVLRYRWVAENRLHLEPHHTISLDHRHGRRGPCEFIRTELAGDREFCSWVSAVLSLVPPERRRARGTVGINLLRTHTQVVTGPHQDHEEFIIIYVMNKLGDGAETRLHAFDNVEDIVYQSTLAPGEFIIFDDARFYHSATSLSDTGSGNAQRDVIVCTIDYPTTYALDE